MHEGVPSNRIIIAGFSQVQARWQCVILLLALTASGECVDQGSSDVTIAGVSQVQPWPHFVGSLVCPTLLC